MPAVELFLTTSNTTIYAPEGVITASDHGEGSLDIRDTCNLALPECEDECEDLEPVPTMILSAGLKPTRGPNMNATTMATASYRENMRVFSDKVARIQFTINWQPTDPEVSTFEHERNEYGLWLRAHAERKARATFTVVAGDFSFTKSTKKSLIWQSFYTQL